MNEGLRNTLTSPSEARFVPELAPNPELLSSLGRLVRGLSALFWGLPIALVVCVQTANGEWSTQFGVFPPVIATGLLLYGLNLLGRFQKQERIWILALDRARIFALVNLGLSPFLFWWNQIQSQSFFNTMVWVMAASGLLFLLALNPVLGRLSAMLPDETLRLETKFFTRINCYILSLDFAFLALYLSAPWLERIGLSFPIRLPAGFQPGVLGLGLLLVLIPVAMTMALLWKTKEVIVSSIFGPTE